MASRLATARPSLRRRVLEGYLWNFGGEGAAFVVIAATESVRSHLIPPDQIGLVVAGLWLVGLVRGLGGLGLGMALVQKTDLTPAQLTSVSDAVRWFSLGAGLLIGLAAPLLGLWNRNPEVTLMAAALAPLALLEGLAIPHRARLTQQLRFAPIVRATLVGAIATLATLVPLALVGLGAWSIAAAMLVGSGAQTLLLRAASELRPVRPADPSRLREALGFGGDVAGSNLLFYLYTNADYLLLGRFWSERALALYFNAFRLAELPGSRVANLFNRVAFPAFVELKGDPAGLRAHFLQTVRSIALVSFPIALGLVAVADDVVLALYGPRWSESIPLVRLLALVFLVRSVQVVGPAALLALGHARANLVISLVFAATLIPALVVGVRQGPLGVAVAWLATSVPLNLGLLWFAARRLGLTVGTLLRAMLPAALRATVTMAPVALLGLALPRPDPEHPVAWAWLRLAIEVAAGGALYGAWTLAAEPGMRRLVGRALSRPA